LTLETTALIPLLDLLHIQRREAVFLMDLHELRTLLLGHQGVLPDLREGLGAIVHEAQHVHHLVEGYSLVLTAGSEAHLLLSLIEKSEIGGAPP
jgi:hypothetical protein